ncbi:N-acetyltransferase [Streptomyces sp. 6N223]|uniref:N-acetyltransferase n=1 Tax=Streptomyces sp. 6N223 TaxID=3457412 RepID=UPI003FD4751D
MPFTIRPFRRDDREQLTALVNAHIAAAVPGLSVSVNAVLSRLDREPDEPLVDPWVAERVTLVAEQRARVVAAAHVRRYGAGPEVARAYRNAGEIQWLLYWPMASAGDADAAPAAQGLMAACLALFDRWGVAARWADAELPAPAAYGVTEQWPHIAALFQESGFRQEGNTEQVLIADVAELPRPAADACGLEIRRVLGVNGTRFTALTSKGAEAGYIEIDTTIHDTGRFTPHAGWADIGNLEADPFEPVATALLAHAADWLRLARVDRLLAYAIPEDDADELALLPTLGFRHLTTIRRGWVRGGVSVPA